MAHAGGSRENRPPLRVIRPPGSTGRMICALLAAYGLFRFGWMGIVILVVLGLVNILVKLIGRR